MGRNPIQNAGCYGILKSVQENPGSAIEALDFSVRNTYLISMSISANVFFSDLFRLFSVYH